MTRPADDPPTGPAAALAARHPGPVVLRGERGGAPVAAPGAQLDPVRCRPGSAGSPAISSTSKALATGTSDMLCATIDTAMVSATSSNTVWAAAIPDCTASSP
jgi:hypothetical protein